MALFGIGGKDGGGLLGGIGNFLGEASGFNNLTRGASALFQGNLAAAGTELVQGGVKLASAGGTGGLNPLALGNNSVNPFGGGFNPASLLGLGGNQGQNQGNPLIQLGLNALGLGNGNTGGVYNQARSPWDWGNQSQNNGYGQYPYGTPSFNPNAQYQGYGQNAYGNSRQDPLAALRQYGFNIFANNAV
jgi:hypothetical protein